jgi:hypothetical protein
MYTCDRHADFKGCAACELENAEDSIETLKKQLRELAAKLSTCENKNPAGAGLSCGILY